MKQEYLSDKELMNKWYEILLIELGKYYYAKKGIIPWIHQKFFKVSYSHISDIENKIILDIGCGNGAILEYLENKIIKKYICVDICFDFLKHLRDKNNKNYVLCLCADAHKLPFKQSSVDTIITMASLEHFINLDVAVNNMLDILKVNGRIIASIPCEGGWVWKIGRYFSSRRYFINKYGIDFDRIIKLWHPNTAKKIMKKFKSIKNAKIILKKYFPFNILKTYHCNLFLNFIVRKIKNNDKNIIN